MKEPIIKKRKIVVTGMGDQVTPIRIKDFLDKKTGIIALNINTQKGFVRVEYDLRKINFETIEKFIKELGFKLSKKITEKFKRGMAKFTEQNELDNLGAKPSSCCSDPKEKACKLIR